MKTKALTISLLVICLSLIGCTKTKLAYSFLDNWLRWETENYFDPTPQQKQLLKQHSKQFHHWHRNQELTILAEFTGQTAELLGQPTISAEHVNHTFEQISDIYQRSAQELSKITDALLPTLSDEQIQQVMQKLDEQSQEYQEKYLAVSKQQRIEDRADDMENFVSGIVGKLTEEQKQLLMQWSSDMTGLAAEGLLQQRFWQQAFAQALAQDRTNPANLDKLAELIFQELQPLNTQHQKAEQTNRQLTEAMLAQLHGTLNDKQRTKLQKRLNHYQRDFLEIAENSTD